MARPRTSLIVVTLAIALSALACQLSPDQERAIQEISNQAGTAVATAASGIGDEAGTAVSEAIDEAIPDIEQPADSDSSGTSRETARTYAYGSNCPLSIPYIRVPSNITELQLRAGAGTDYQRLGYVVAGECYSVLGNSGSWLRISTSIGEGWVSSQYVEEYSVALEPETFEENPVAEESAQLAPDTETARQEEENSPSPTRDRIYICRPLFGGTDDLRLFSGPGFDYPLIGYIVNCRSYELLERQNNWFRIRTYTNEGYNDLGWISSSYVWLYQEEPVEPLDVVDTGANMLEVGLAAGRAAEECTGIGPPLAIIGCIGATIWQQAERPITELINRVFTEIKFIPRLED